MNKSSKKVENEKMKNKLNDEIDVENMEIANLIKKDSEDIPKISTDINVINQIRTTGRKNKKNHNDRTYDSCNMHSRTSFPPASI